MKSITFTVLILFAFSPLFPQLFERTELTTYLDTPWEICYGADGFLWITESKGKVSRVNPVDGSKTVVYTAPDYFGGSITEKSQDCFRPDIGSGTLGLALHPDFPDSSYIYFVHSYNQGTSAAPNTRFKIVRLRWNVSTSKVVEANDLVTDLPNGYDHLGGRLIAIKQEGLYYLYFSTGDNGVSEQNNPDCYSNQVDNPNNHTQDPDYKNGKIHRFYIDGSIPFDNPLPENSFFTRGHRNPQGLVYNPQKNIIYEIEHGDRSDDEINILIKGMNYGWKNVRGYHDNNFTGEEQYINNYKPDPAIANDSLIEAIYSWCEGKPSTNPNNSNWCTVAPTDGAFYNSTTIPEWTNSLLVVTLKNGTSTDQELFQFKLSEDGKSIDTSANNPKKYFTADQSKNGRLRDIAISPNGNKIFLINNGGADRDKITVYTHQSEDSTVWIGNSIVQKEETRIYPNPVKNILKIEPAESIENIEISNTYGLVLISTDSNSHQIDVSKLTPGLYLLVINKKKQNEKSFMFLKE